MAKKKAVIEDSGDSKLLESRIDDAFESASRYNGKFIGFLDPHERSVAVKKAKQASAVFSHCSYIFWGGYEGAERAFLGVFPPYSEPCNNDFPIIAIDIKWRFAILTHRDFLGALLALGIVRKKIGDIIVGDGECMVFAERTVAEFIVQNLAKVGRAGVSCEISVNGEFLGKTNFREIGGTIASPRLDCVVSALAGKSRTASNELIRSGLVSLNFEIAEDTSEKAEDGSTVSIRGLGRFVVDKIGPMTKKGRYSFSARKYL